MLEKLTEDSAKVSPRALEALRWAAQCATIDPEKLAHQPERPSPEELRALPLEVLREELDQLLMGRYTQEGLDALLAIGVLDVFLPEVHAMVGFGDGEFRHKDVWKHTKQVVWQSVPRIRRVAMKRPSSLSPDSKTVTMCGCSSAACTCASRRKRSRKPESFERCGASTFSATVRLSESCVAS